ncbi:6-pyruvoyl trahydropterin synthase family protein [Mycobacterium pseudokansasii]|nr:6-carboxytetrahydropterin synthase [Mycobacterium pseudokansasii]EUA00976.1 6-pyruvoyl tetrahydropterin synthase family protein [Mycobacterium kansasii 732]MBY0387787.1 6-carboxytetrahydropterin synthase [Mycobacterium pseudokansasii]
MPYTIKQTFRVEIGHRTWSHHMPTSRGGSEFYTPDLIANKCANLHGHTIFVSVTLVGDSLDEQYFLLDTDLLEQAFRPILDEFDFAFVVDRHDPLYEDIAAVVRKGGLKLCTVDFSPTFEGLVRHFYDRLQAVIAEKGLADQLRIKEMKVLGELTVEATYSGEGE